MCWHPHITLVLQGNGLWGHLGPWRVDEDGVPQEQH